ncbi:MAG: carboxypeptidase regulatory-like domain-containing protein [Myxococcales bacterium]|nr:carboxypeptidase regulatory-like domain-containing protein [Myxococcales bacterium]
MMKLSRLAPLLALFALACSTEQTASGVCQSDADCGGDACNLATGQCQTRASRAPAIEVLPTNNNNQGWVLQEFPNPTLGPDGVAKLTLRQTVSLQGIVYASGDETTAIPARIRVWRTSSIPGRPDVEINATALDEAAVKRSSRKDPPDVGYQVWVEPGYKYNIIVTPEAPFDTRFPPARYRDIEIKDHKKLDLAVHGDADVVTVRGSVTDASGNAPLPFPVRVRAYSDDPSWRRSTVGWTCSQNAVQHCPGSSFTTEANGGFAIRIPPSTGPGNYVVRVEPVPDAAQSSNGVLQVVPTIECNGVVLGLLDNTGLAEITLEGPIKMPAFKFGKNYTFSVVGGAPAGSAAGNADRPPIVGARVTFTLSLPTPKLDGAKECTAEYSITKTTDAEGKVQVPLLPGSTTNLDYTVTVTTPAESPYASRKLMVAVGSQGGVLQTLELEPRHELSGTVVDAAGKPVAGAVINARAAVSAGYSLVASQLTPGSASATSDAEGKFVLYVDPGVFDFFIEPPAAAALPNFWLHNRSVEGSTYGLELKAPAARVLAGRLFDLKGAPAPDFAVNAYEQVGDRALLRASTRTGSDGKFSLLLAE